MHLTKNKASKCIMARITRRGELYQENFSLRKYRTWREAEKAATKWIRKMLRELPPIDSGKGRMTKRNSSGVVGVWPVLDTHYRGENRYEYARWCARWPNCPTKGGIRWSVNEFGDNDAFVLAVLSRENESVDREWLVKKLGRIRKTAKYRQLLKNKQISFV